MQGDCLDLALGLDYDGQKEGGTPKKGKLQHVERGAERHEVEVVYKRNRKLSATRHKPPGKLTRPNGGSRQEK